MNALDLLISKNPWLSEPIYRPENMTTIGKKLRSSCCKNIDIPSVDEIDALIDVANINNLETICLIIMKADLSEEQLTALVEQVAKDEDGEYLDENDLSFAHAMVMIINELPRPVTEKEGEMIEGLWGFSVYETETPDTIRLFNELRRVNGGKLSEKIYESVPLACQNRRHFEKICDSM